MPIGANAFRLIILICSTVAFAILFSILASCHSSVEKQSRDENSVVMLLNEAKKVSESNPSGSIKLTDSAMNIIKTCPVSDTVLLKLYGIRAFLFSNTEKADSAMVYYQKASDIAEQSGDSLKLARYLRNLADLQTQYGSIKQAEKNYLKAIEVYGKMGRKYDAAQTKICYTQLLTFMGQFELSQEKLMEAYLLLDKMDSLEAEISVFNGIGNNFKEVGNYRQAVIYYLKAYQTAIKFSDHYNVLVALNNAGTCYKNLDSDSALICFQKALAISARVGVTELEVMVRYNIGNYQLKKRQYQQATKIFEEVLLICRREKIIDGVIRAYSGLAEIAEKTGQLSKSLELCGKAITLADSTGRMALKLTLMKQKYEIIRKGGDCKATLTLSEDIKTLEDSIMNSEKQLEIYKMERQYRSEKTELENSNLKLEVASQAARLSYRQNFILILVVALLVLSFLLFLLYRTFRERTFAYKVLIGQYEEERMQKKSFREAEEVVTKPEISGIRMQEEFKESELLLVRLQNYFNLDKPYLDPKLKVDTVAEALSVTPKTIAAALKGYRDNNFNLFVNRYRVETAKLLLEDPVSRQYKIEVIAMKAGFGSKQSFYNAFEQFTGIRPSYYRQHIMTNPGNDFKDASS